MRVVIFFAVWLGVWLPFAVPLAFYLKWRPLRPAAPSQKLPLLASLYFVVLPVLWQIKQLEGQTWRDYGLAIQPPLLQSFFVSFGQGFLIAALGIGVLMLVQVMAGWRHGGEFDQATPLSFLGAVRTMLPLFAIATWVSLTEELIFRGFLLNELSALPSGSGAAVVSVIFALSHLLWEGRTQILQLPGLWLMGMVLVVARWVDGGSLALAMGLHAGWVWSIACVDTLQLLPLVNDRPRWLTGNPDQPLAGGLPLLLLLMTAALLWRVAVPLG
jgi:hypothetical protein